MQTQDLNSLLSLPPLELILLADKERRKHLGFKFELCGIMNAKSGLCAEDCKFCAQSLRYSTGVDIYPLKSERQIIAAAYQAKENGKELGTSASASRLLSRDLKIHHQLEERIASFLYTRPSCQSAIREHWE